MTKSITFKINDVEYTEDEAKELYAFLHKHFGHLERARPSFTINGHPCFTDSVALLNTKSTDGTLVLNAQSTPSNSRAELIDIKASVRPIDPEYPKIY